MSHARPAPLARRLLALALAYLVVVGSVPAAFAQKPGPKDKAGARASEGKRPVAAKAKPAEKSGAPRPLGVNSWTTTGPEGLEQIDQFVVNPNAGQTVYAVSPDNNVYRSTDGGATWSPRNNGFGVVGVRRLAIDPAAPGDTLYAATSSTAAEPDIYKTTDGGANWTGLTNGLPSSSGANVVVVDPVTPATVYAGYAGQGVYKTANGGGVWAAANTGMPTSPTVTDLVIDPFNPANLYAAVNSTTAAARGVYKTTNGGASWTKMSAGLATGSVTPVVLLADPVTNGVVFAGVADNNPAAAGNTPELYRTTDGGASWAASSAGLADKFPQSMAATATGKLYFVSASDVAQSTDGGVNWTPVGTNGYNAPWPQSVGTDPTDPNVLFSGTEDVGVYKSTDGGANWTWSSAGLSREDYSDQIAISPGNSSVIYSCQQSSGIYKSADGGASWAPASKGFKSSFGICLSLAIDPSDPDVLYAGTSGDRVFKSTDAAASWAQVGVGSPGFDIEALLVDPSNPQIVYASETGDGVYKSTDGGATFGPSHAGIADTFVFDLDFDPTNSAIIYATVGNTDATRDGVYKSTNAGATWTRMIAGITNPDLYQLSVAPAAPQTLYASGTGGVFRSTDGAATWSPINAGLPAGEAVYSVAADPSNAQRVYAGVTDNGVYQSADGGQTWAALGAGLPALEMLTIAVSASGNKVFVGTSQGVYEYQIVTSGTFIVNSTLDAADANTADGLCDDGAGNCTLRAAIQQANAAAGADSIQFDIPGAGVHTISLAAALPSITEAATVDGYTQPTASPNTLPVGNNAALRVRLDGQPLHVAASNSTVRGLSFTNSGITLNGASNVTVEGNFVGLDPAGAGGNGQGIEIIGGANNQIGTTGAAGRNVVSGSAAAGITLDGTTGNAVRNNYVGTNPAGTSAVGNAGEGIRIDNAGGNTVGGASAAARNVISGNLDSNIVITGAAATGNIIRGNFVGTNAAGTAAVANFQNGIQLGAAANNNTVGGTAPGAGNVISGSQFDGVNVASTGNVIQGNFIGTDAAGTAALPNGADGIGVGANNNQIGGTAAGAGNAIAFNTGNGVSVFNTTTGVLVSGNSIHSNGALGIDLNGDGLTVNDGAGDPDAGANNSQNFPALATAAAAGNTTMITGALTSAPNTQYAVEFFSSASCDPSDNGEGRTFLGAANVTTDGAGSASINATLARASFMGEAVTATATDPANNTSEFSACVTVGSPDLVVTTTADAGAGSLRQAILDANTVAGAQTIVFNIPGAGPHAIAPLSALPAITQPVTIDGYTQPGASANTQAAGNDAALKIVLSGASAGAAVNGLHVTGGSSTVRGLVIQNFTQAGVRLENGGGNTVAGCFVGTDPTGVQDRGNATNGVIIVSSSNNTVGGAGEGARNVISGNNSAGIEINGGNLTGNVISNNYVGTMASGQFALPNSAVGINVGGTPNINNTTIGGTTPGERNLISGNNSHGIQVGSSAVNGLFIRGNYVGTNAAGDAAIPNGVDGVFISFGANIAVGGDDGDDGVIGDGIFARNVISGNTQDGIDATTGSNSVSISGNYIGTDAAGAGDLGNGSDGIDLGAGSGSYSVGRGTPAGGNVISGNNGHGILISNSGNKTIQANLIGTNAAGTAAVANSADGIRTATNNNQIGGASAADRNVISGNASDGIEIGGGSGNVIRGNLIGTKADGTTALANGAAGVNLPSTATNSQIGGAAAGEGNTIAFNTTDGVAIANGTGHLIAGNSIHSNGTAAAHLGVDLGTDGRTLNDANDADAGANNLQNYPVISLVEPQGGNTRFVGALNSTAATAFAIDFYSNPACDPVGSGEGKTYLATTNVTTDASGNASFDVAVPLAVAVAAGEAVTAAARTAAGNTSEFSFCHVVGTSPTLVTNTNDTGVGSLREAINHANGIPGAQTVSFAIPASDPNCNASGVCTISPATAFPVVTDPVQIDGLTQAGATANTLAAGSDAALKIELNGTLTPAGTSGLTITAGSSTVRGLVINRFKDRGIVLQTGGNNVVAGNFIGTNVAGAAASINQNGGLNLVNSPGNVIGGTAPAARNVIVSNGTALGSPANDTGGGNTIQGNYFGTNAAGTAALGVGGLVFLTHGNNQIGGAAAGAGNVISNSGNTGLVLSDGAADNNTVQGNFIGLGSDGSTVLGSPGAGISIVRAENNQIGGASAAARNVILSGGGSIALNIAGGTGAPGTLAQNNRVQGNYFGTNAAGTARLPGGISSSVAVRLSDAQDNLIGGTGAGEGNLIAGFNVAVSLIGGGAAGAPLSGNLVQGNLIGTNAAGTAALPNSNGVVVNYQSNAAFVPAAFNQIGGATAAARNVISGNAADAVQLTGLANKVRVQGNYVGVAADGTTALPNLLDGVEITNGSNNEIGGTGAGEANLIAHNGADGVVVFAGTNNRLRGNSIFNNGTTAQHLGIDLAGADGVNANDAGDADAGANNRQNFPVVTSVTVAAGNTRIQGTFNSAASASFDLEFFTNPACDASGNGEGRTPVNAAAVTTDASGNAAFDFTLTGVDLTGHFVTATATGSATGDTSEFSRCAATPSTFTVTNTNNAGAGSLRQAILDANASVGSLDAVAFSIAGPGPHVITLSSALPVITDPLILDAATEPDYAVGAPAVELRGAGAVATGFNVTAGASTVRGFIINGFTTRAIHLQNGGGNKVQGNFVGTNAAGTAAAASLNGEGIRIDNSPGNLIGGDEAGERNVISANSAIAGVTVVNAGSNGNTISGNYIGTDKTGMVDLGNAGSGIFMEGTAGGSLNVGGMGTGEGNVIAGNDTGQVFIGKGNSTVRGNFIGVNAAGTACMGGTTSGVEIDRASNNTVGGDDDDDGAADGVVRARNVIGCSFPGVLIVGSNTLGAADNNAVQGNLIGTDATGTTDLGNTHSGVHLDSPAVHNTLVGGASAGAGNVIAFTKRQGGISGGAGVTVEGVGNTGNLVSGNSIRANARLGIDLGNNDVTANDAGDGDTGANNLQNFPVVTSVTNSAGSTTVQGTLNSHANRNFRVEVFHSAACDALGSGQGDVFVGSQNVTTVGNDGTFSLTVPELPPNRAVTAVAVYTDAAAAGAATNDTSEFSPCAATPALITPLTVTNTNDSGAGSLRQAILNANAAPNGATPDLIDFSIAGAGPHTITPATALPAIAEAVLIDGYTQGDSTPADATDDATPNTLAAGNDAVLKIVVAGNGGLFSGLTIASAGSTVRGLVINGFTAGGASAGAGVHIVGASADNNAITGCFIGTNAAGTAAATNSIGVWIRNGAGNNAVGGATPAERNLVSGNNQAGVRVGDTGAGEASTTGNVVQNNYVGTNAAGTAALQNFGEGVVVRQANNTTVGGAGAGAGNVISGNGGAGLYVESAAGAQAQGNRVGTNAAGTAAVPNVSYGVHLSAATSSTVGGATAAHRNLISGNASEGIYLSNGSNNAIRGNYVGTDAAGAGAIPNGTGNPNAAAIEIDSPASTNNQIGGTNAGDGNRIAFNATAGVALTNTGAGNSILGNEIHSNGTTAAHLGIDLDQDGVTPNDDGDADTGPNDYQNFPAVSSAIASGGTTTVSGTLKSTPSTNNYRLEFFASPACDASGNGEGARFLGSTTVSTDAGGDAAFTNVVLTAASVPRESVTATATDAAGNTSEFSACREVTPPPVFVTNTNDTGAGSLRAAITAANAAAGLDAIYFQIPGAGVHVISPATPLPTITDSVILDATTQPGYAGAPVVQLDGNAAGGGSSGLHVTAGASDIRGLSVTRFDDHGVFLETGDGNAVAACYLGTNPAGAAGFGNGRNGLYVDNASNNNTVGGSTAGARNVISANGESGIQIFSGSNNVVRANFIGVAPDGVTPLGNTLPSVMINGGGTNNFVGGTGATDGNVIAHSLNDAGVLISQGTGNRILGNSIRANTGRGITLMTGGNAGQPAPALTGTTFPAGAGFVQGTLTAAPNTTYRVELFDNDACDSSGAGEGEKVLGGFDVTTDGAGAAAFNQPVGGFAPGDVLTATATSPAGNTSQFSPCLTAASVLTVTNTNDAGAGSLRAAILDANANAGVADTIQFNIAACPGAGVCTIAPASALPAITDPVTIDGYTQGGASTNTLAAGNNMVLRVELSGAGAGAGARGLLVTGGSSNVRGLSIYGFAGAGIELNGGPGNTVAGCLIGLKADGTAAANGDGGVDIQSSPGNVIGGPTPASRNVISGNGNAGVRVVGVPSDGNRIAGCYIGTNAAGTAASPNNTGVGVADGDFNVIGGTTAGERNVISGNTQSGVAVSGVDTFFTSVTGNFIGTNANGDAAVPNGADGVLVANHADNTIIGGPTGTPGTGEGNVISGNNGDGIELSGVLLLATVSGNAIGSNAALAGPIPNNQNGIRIASSEHTIGGTSNADANLITANALDGISVQGAVTGNRIHGNSIHGNGTTAQHLGIDLTDDGATPNDADDPDAGANNLQNFPLITAVTSGGTTTVSGTLNSTPSTNNFRLEFFASPACDASGNGEGARFLGSVNVNTDSEGNAAFNPTLASATMPGEAITATATDPSGNTSEFSACFTIPAVAQTFTVTNTADSGAGSLRQAILGANANAGALDTIAFAIPGAGPHTIAPASALPAITDPALIDGYTQGDSTPADATDDAAENTSASGTNAVIKIELNGAGAGAGANGLSLVGTASGSTVRGLAVNRFTRDGISLNGSDSNTISGNFIGTDTTGLVDLGNGSAGVEGEFGSNADNNLIGGTTPAARNLISGNGGSGITFSFASGNVIRGNFIGLGADGATQIGNGGTGVNIDSFVSGFIVGGDDAADGAADGVVNARNLISGNGGSGIFLGGAGFGGAAVRGNFIGTDATGTLARPNGNGIDTNLAHNAVFGGASAGAGNLISGNTGDAVRVGNADGVIVKGNLIGTQAGGALALANTGNGVFLFAGSDNAQVGGAAAGEANVIAFNGQDGVRADSGTGTRVSANSIHSNGTAAAHLGIDLGTDGVTANDANDADTGANNLQNFPALSLAATAGGTTTVQGTLNSAAATAFRVEFFSNAACDAAGGGEGRTFLGSQDVTTDAAGNATVNATLAAATTAGESVTATATDPAGNTSEFSACRAVTTAGAATDVSWTNAAGGDWHTAANWQDGTGASRVPSANDNVFITLAGNYAVTMSADARPASLTLGDGASAQTLNTGAFTLTLANASAVRANAVLNLNGTLSGAGALEVLGTLNHSGNAAAGAGAINVRAGGVVNFGGTQPRLARTLNNEGTANYNPASSMILNGAAFNNLAGSTFNVAAEKVLAQQGAVSTFVNRGTVRKAAGAGETEFNLAFDNMGTVDLQSGSLRFGAGGASAGAFNGAAGTVLKLVGHDLQAGSSVAAAAVEFSGANGTVAGTYNVTGATTLAGTTNFTGNVQSVGQTLNVTGTAGFNSNAVAAQTVNITGSVNGSADLSPTATGTMNLSGALDGTGATNVAAGATLNLQGTQPRLSRTVNNLGTTNFAAASSMVMSGATFNNQPGATFNVQSDALLFQLGAVSTFNNAGTLRKLTGAGDAEFRISFNNSGAVDLQSGGLDFSVGGASAGTFTATAGTQLKLNGHNLQAASAVNAVTLSLSGATTVAGTFNVSQTTNVTGGTSTFTGNVQSVGQTLNVAGAAHFNSNAVSAPAVNVTGTLGGTANVGPTSGGALDLNGGTLTGAGATDIPAGAALTLRGTQPTLARAVNNSGTTDYAATSSMVFNGGAFNNLPGATFNVNSETLLFELGAPSTFTNAGTVRKTTGAGAAEFRISFNNNGAVDLQSGELNFSARGTSSGAFNGTAGTTLRLAGQTLQPAATVAAPTVFLSGTTAFAGTLNATGTTNVAGTATFTGNVQNAGATLNVTGTGTFNSNGFNAQTVNVTGTLGGSADVTVPAGGSFNLTGGTLASGGTTTIPATATLNLGGNQPNLARAVNNSGTANYTAAAGMVFNGATFNNLAGGTFNVQSDTVLQQAGAGATFNNAGALAKGAGAGAAEFRMSFTNAGTVTASAGTLHFSVGNYTQTAGATVLNGGGVQTTGLLDVQGGVLRGSGTITGNVRNAAALRPGLSPGCTVINGDYEQTAAATLDIEIGGATPCTQFDRLQVTGAATLAGTLAATLVNGFTPAAAQPFQVVTFASRTGTFSAVTGPLAAQYGATDVTVADVTPSATLTVTNTADSGAGSLRQAILDSNAQAGVQTIDFQIAAAGVQTIAPLSALPTVTDPVQIDGYTQTGASANTLAVGNDAVLLVELSGANLAAGSVGLKITAGGSTVRGLVVNRFGTGIELSAAGGNTVQGNRLGTNAAGTSPLGNSTGLLTTAGSTGNLVGGATPAARNLVSGNTADGIFLGTGGNTVQGNYVGTNADTSEPLQNGASGVAVVGSSGNDIGGTTAAARNVISGNAGGGVEISDSSATNNVVRGNYIGLRADGAAALPNAQAGVAISGAPGNTVGGAAAGAGNVVSGNGGAGILISGSNATGNAVRGNFVGTDAAGAAAVSNAADGVAISNAAASNTVGGGGAGAGNLIAFNAGDGISHTGGAGNAFTSNSIHSNGTTAQHLGIDLGADGVNANDAGDTDTGANDSQNYPVITSAVASGGATQITGTLNSAPNAALNVEFFTSPACDASGSGEGQTRLGVIAVTTDAAGNAPVSFNAGAALPPGQSVTATATDAAGNTSEFSACRAVTGPAPATFTISGAVSDSNGNPVGDVLMTLNGGPAGTTTAATNSAGSYSFPNLAGGANYTLTPALANFSFAPASRTYNGLAADQTAQDFTAAANPGAVQFSAANYSAAESGGGIFVTVTRTGNTAGAATVNYADTPGTASAADYSGGTGSVTFAAGEATKNFTVGVANDTLDEPDESFALALSVGSGNVVLGAQGTATVTVTDDDAAPTISVNDVTLAEGNSGQTNAVFQISLSAASGQAVTANYATADGTAASASGDYAAQSGTATLPAGTTSFAVAIAVNGDTAVEPDETFFLNLTAPANASIGDAQGQATITNDDAAQTFSITGRVTNPANNQPLANVTVAVSGGHSGATQTDANGDYSFANLAGGGNYTVTPSLANHTFAPPSRSFGNLAANQTADFSGTLNAFAVSGRVADAANNALAGVTLTLSGAQSATAQTDAGGNYSFASLAAGGTYTVTPSLPNFSFAPPSRSFGNLQANQTADFAGGLASVTVSGRITDEDAQPVGGVAVALVAPIGDDSEQPLSTTQTDANGDYSFVAPVGGTYVVRPARAGMIFTPPVHIFRNATGNRTGDFRALDAFQISGNLSDLVAPGAKAARAQAAAEAGNVVVTLSGTRSGTTLTDAAGSYTFTNLPLGGTYRVTPQNPFNLFNPPFVAFPDLGGNGTADFGADANPNPTPTPPTRDDFSGPARDADRFSLGTLTQPPGATDPLVAVEQRGGKLVITPRTNFTGLSFNGYVTTRSVDFTNATASIAVDQIATGGAQTIFSVGKDDQNFFRFVAQEQEAAPSSVAASANGDKSNAAPRTTLQQLLLQVRAAGIFNSLTIPYDPVAHKYWRFRHDAAAAPVPALFFEASPTGADGTWSVLRVVPVAGAVGSLATEISAGTAGAVASPGRAIFDDLNVVPPQTAVAVGAYRLAETTMSVAEGAGSFRLRVRRTGVLAGESTVDVASEPFDNRPCPTADGRARPRCDFSTTFARLRFAAGESEKTVTVFLTDDVYAEGDETFRLALGNPSSGFSLDAAAANVTIRDDDQPGARNPINDADFFVRQQYLDFLSREPDAGGFSAWAGVLRRCAFEGHFGPGKSNSDPNCDRILVSSSFYRSTEFHERGFFAYRFYEVALGRQPTYEEFLSDMQRLSGSQTEAEQEANKVAFVKEFMARGGFGGRQSFADMNGNLDTPQRLDQLLARAGVTLAGRDRLAADLAAGRVSPAQALRAVAESGEASSRFYNRAFVSMQYFGYLQRDPEPSGFQAWLNHLNANPTDYRTMIFGFLYSHEYQSRFGPVQ